MKDPWRKRLLWLYWLFDILLAAILLWFIFTDSIRSTPRHVIGWIIGLMVLSLAPKVFILPFLLAEDAWRLIKAAVTGISRLFNKKEAGDKPVFDSRRKFISRLALGVGAIPFAGTIYGMIKGKYDFTVHRITLPFKDLPDAFNGLTITQLSDIHVGSFDSHHAVLKGIELANKQNSDIIFFTGDLVNNSSDEMEGWVDIFSRLKAPMGKFSILGNHDYGDYSEWPSAEAKAANLKRLKEIHGELGFKLMLNENLLLTRGNESISLVGVENWGKKFTQYGDLNKAMQGVPDNNFKLLLSHDPTHWEAQVLEHPGHIHLTLSGHTHGTQFGVEIPGFRWSPAQYVYNQWAGTYHKNDQCIYVNRGFGYIGFPGRVGIFPEITVITLQKA